MKRFDLLRGLGEIPEQAVEEMAQKEQQPRKSSKSSLPWILAGSGAVAVAVGVVCVSAAMRRSRLDTPEVPLDSGNALETYTGTFPLEEPEAEVATARTVAAGEDSYAAEYGADEDGGGLLTGAVTGGFAGSEGAMPEPSDGDVTGAITGGFAGTAEILRRLENLDYTPGAAEGEAEYALEDGTGTRYLISLTELWVSRQKDGAEPQTAVLPVETRDWLSREFKQGNIKPLNE